MLQALQDLDQTLHKVRFAHSPLFTLKESQARLLKIRDEIRKSQPQLGGQLHLNESQSYPEFLALGVLEVRENPPEGLEESFEKFFIPKVTPFPPPALYGSTENTPRFLREGLLRLVSTIPLTHLQVVLVDALSLGGVFALARRFLKKDHDFIYRQKIFTEGDEIKEALKDLYEYMKTNLQEKLAGYKDFMDYNRYNTDRLEVRALFLSGVDALDHESRGYLQHLVRFGAANGVLCFIYNLSEKEERSKEEVFLDRFLEKHAQKFESVPTFEHLRLRALHDSTGTHTEHLNAFAKEVANYYARRKQVKREVGTLQQQEEFWSKNSTHVVSVPIGWDKDCREVLFEIGGDQTQHHTLVCGRSGSGKSNFLNVLIQNLAFYYSPDELRLFLLDYKEGVEFNAYANPPLEHAQLVSVQACVSYGITFLEWLNQELERRARLFKDCGVKDFKGYRQTHGLPRFVVIIDEFQVLFMNAKKLEEMKNLVVNLLKKGRSYGVHMVFSTQTMAGGTIPKEILGQIGNRMALAVNDKNDSISVLGNDAATRLEPKKGLYSFVGEQKDDSMMVYTSIPYAANEKLPDFIIKTNKEARERGIKPIKDRKLYNGEEPIYMPQKLKLHGTSLQLGVGVDYEGREFILPLEEGDHLLFVGTDEAKIIWLKILAKNLQALGKKLYHYNASKALAKIQDQLQPYGIAPTHTNAQIFEENLEPGSFILIDSLDEAQELYEKKSTGLAQLKASLNSARDYDHHYIVMLTNLKKISSTPDLKDILEVFRHRIVFKSNQENLDKATSLEIKERLERTNARFFDKSTDAHMDFRPYSFKDLGKES
ncbi:ATP-binding protein [Helicobacter sp. NHP21005]|uniref:FtsK/SpoIIIE domain-containing protein n=1 Tax=Helicobacter felistomachi TaxID=3040201 RepID=UPI0025736498|nr:FtsK/SpoIIIE domain-containing protein [Helicobacter sp. NHP21005]BEG57736.1 ATP-binding protein [Helicobacter sp. NHP21005]